MVGVDTTSFIKKLEPPSNLTKAGKGIWVRLIDSIPNENLIPSDFPLMEVYCEVLATFQNAKKMTEEQGEVIVMESNGRPIKNPWTDIMLNAAGKLTSLSIKLGLAPSSRMKADERKGKIGETEQTTSLGKLING